MERGKTVIRIYSDSEYAVKSVNKYLADWIVNDNTAKKNIKYIVDIHDRMKSSPFKIELLHIRAHQMKATWKSMGNHLSDFAAVTTVSGFNYPPRVRSKIPSQSGSNKHFCDACLSDFQRSSFVQKREIIHLCRENLHKRQQMENDQRMDMDVQKPRFLSQTPLNTKASPNERLKLRLNQIVTFIRQNEQKKESSDLLQNYLSKYDALNPFDLFRANTDEAYVNEQKKKKLQTIMHILKKKFAKTTGQKQLEILENIALKDKIEEKFQENQYFVVRREPHKENQVQAYSKGTPVTRKEVQTDAILREHLLEFLKNPDTIVRIVQREKEINVKFDYILFKNVDQFIVKLKSKQVNWIQMANQGMNLAYSLQLNSTPTRAAKNLEWNSQDVPRWIFLDYLHQTPLIWTAINYAEGIFNNQVLQCVMCEKYHGIRNSRADLYHLYHCFINTVTNSASYFAQQTNLLQEDPQVADKLKALKDQIERDISLLESQFSNLQELHEVYVAMKKYWIVPKNLKHLAGVVAWATQVMSLYTHYMNIHENSSGAFQNLVNAKDWNEYNQSFRQQQKQQSLSSIMPENPVEDYNRGNLTIIDKSDDPLVIPDYDSNQGLNNSDYEFQCDEEMKLDENAEENYVITTEKLIFDPVSFDDEMEEIQRQFFDISPSTVQQQQQATRSFDLPAQHTIIMDVSIHSQVQSFQEDLMQQNQQLNWIAAHNILTRQEVPFMEDLIEEVDNIQQPNVIQQFMNISKHDMETILSSPRLSNNENEDVEQIFREEQRERRRKMLKRTVSEQQCNLEKKLKNSKLLRSSKQLTKTQQRQQAEEYEKLRSQRTDIINTTNSLNTSNTPSTNKQVVKRLKISISQTKSLMKYTTVNNAPQVTAIFNALQQQLQNTSAMRQGASAISSQEADVSNQQSSICEQDQVLQTTLNLQQPEFIPIQSAEQSSQNSPNSESRVQQQQLNLSSVQIDTTTNNNQSNDYWQSSNIQQFFGNYIQQISPHGGQSNSSHSSASSKQSTQQQSPMHAEEEKDVVNELPIVLQPANQQPADIERSAFDDDEPEIVQPVNQQPVSEQVSIQESLQQSEQWKWSVPKTRRSNQRKERPPLAEAHQRKLKATATREDIFKITRESHEKLQSKSKEKRLKGIAERRNKPKSPAKPSSPVKKPRNRNKKRKLEETDLNQQLSKQGKVLLKSTEAIPNKQPDLFALKLKTFKENSPIISEFYRELEQLDKSVIQDLDKLAAQVLRNFLFAELHKECKGEQAFIVKNGFAAHKVFTDKLRQWFNATNLLAVTSSQVRDAIYELIDRLGQRVMELSLLDPAHSEAQFKQWKVESSSKKFERLRRNLNQEKLPWIRYEDPNSQNLNSQIQEEQPIEVLSDDSEEARRQFLYANYTRMSISSLPPMPVPGSRPIPVYESTIQNSDFLPPKGLKSTVEVARQESDFVVQPLCSSDIQQLQPSAIDASSQMRKKADTLNKIRQVFQEFSAKKSQKIEENLNFQENEVFEDHYDLDSQYFDESQMSLGNKDYEIDVLDDVCDSSVHQKVGKPTDFVIQHGVENVKKSEGRRAGNADQENQNEPSLSAINDQYDEWLRSNRERGLAVPAEEAKQGEDLTDLEELQQFNLQSAEEIVGIQNQNQQFATGGSQEFNQQSQAVNEAPLIQSNEAQQQQKQMVKRALQVSTEPQGAAGQHNNSLKKPILGKRRDRSEDENQSVERPSSKKQKQKDDTEAGKPNPNHGDTWSQQ